MPIISENTKLWLHGLLAAAVTSFSTAASAFLMLPTVFNFSKNGMINMVKVALLPTMIAVFAYLTKSPLPSASVLQPGDTVTLKSPTVAPDGTISGTSATLQKASNPPEVKP